MMIKAQIDRFEENMAVLILEQSNSRWDVLRELLPAGAREGQHVLVELDGEKISKIVVDEDGTVQARERIQTKLERLRRGEHRKKAI
jgi:hypothetical protein